MELAAIVTGVVLLTAVIVGAIGVAIDRTAD